MVFGTDKDYIGINAWTLKTKKILLSECKEALVYLVHRSGGSILLMSVLLILIYNSMQACQNLKRIFLYFYFLLGFDKHYKTHMEI